MVDVEGAWRLRLAHPAPMHGRHGQQSSHHAPRDEQPANHHAERDDYHANLPSACPVDRTTERPVPQTNVRGTRTRLATWPMFKALIAAERAQLRRDVFGVPAQEGCAVRLTPSGSILPSRSAPQESKPSATKLSASRKRNPSEWDLLTLPRSQVCAAKVAGFRPNEATATEGGPAGVALSLPKGALCRPTGTGTCPPTQCEFSRENRRECDRSGSIPAQASPI